MAKDYDCTPRFRDRVWRELKLTFWIGMFVFLVFQIPGLGAWLAGPTWRWYQPLFAVALMLAIDVLVVGIAFFAIRWKNGRDSVRW